jgi:hypothetical protein
MVRFEEPVKYLVMDLCVLYTLFLLESIFKNIFKKGERQGNNLIFFNSAMR